MKSEKEKKRKIKEDDKNRNINQVNLSSIPRPSCAEADRYLKRWNEDENLLARRVGDQKIVAINVGCMHPWMNYEPRSLKEIVDTYEDCQKSFYDSSAG